MEQIKQAIPEIAKDIRLNLSKVLDLAQNDGLTEEQIYGAALAVSYAVNDKELVENLRALLGNETTIKAAQLAAALMSMTNIYYRFAHLTENVEVEHLPAGLRMQGMMNPGVDQATFEIFSLAVSALNGCGTCISSHARQLKEHGLSAPTIARIGRISAVIYAVSVSKNFI